jgi:hypothetical protein
MNFWDSLLQDEPAIQPSAHMSGSVSHVDGGPYPDKIEVVARIWADGETFGPPELVKTMLANRERMASQYEQAANLLQHGLDQNWTRDQYLQALSNMPNFGAIHSLRSMLDARCSRQTRMPDTSNSCGT